MSERSEDRRFFESTGTSTPAPACVGVFVYRPLTVRVRWIAPWLTTLVTPATLWGVTPVAPSKVGAVGPGGATALIL